MFSKIKYFKPLSMILGSIFLVSVLTLSLPVSSAEFYPKNDNEQNIEIKATRDNVYAAGNEIKVTESVARDLVLAGSKITITGNVGRSIMVAGSEVDINSSRVGGASRIAGSKVTISGNFGEEVIVAGSDVVIENANINGDLIVAANKLTIKNSRISGDAKLSYSQADGDLQAQVLGTVTKNESKRNENSFYGSANVYSFLVTQFSVIVFLLVVGSILSRRNSLALSDIDFSGRYWKDLGIGLGFAFLTLPVVILLSIVQLYPLALLLGTIIYLSFFLSSFFFPIYLANLIKNTAKLDTKISTMVIVTYLVVAILSFIPVINVISFLVFFVIQSANFGYLTRKLNGAVFASLPQPSKSEIKNDKKKKSETKEVIEETESKKADDSKMEQE